MIAPHLPQGLTLVIQNELTSKPYVEMTLAMLAEAGIQHQWNSNKISIAKQAFKKAELTIEPDWSAASYWYSLVALSDDGDVFLSNLKKESLQGDSAIVEIMSGFGVQTLFTDGGLWLKKTSVFKPQKHYNLKECPDLAQTVIVCSAALGYDAEFSGLETLRIKETDRILALQNELAKIGVKLIEDGANYRLDCSGGHFPQQASFPTYEDHRMAMALAPLAMFIPEVQFDDEKVVGKSYPNFWKDLESVGFKVEGEGLKVESEG
ncbi:MAG: 3-phosphoshikimate 1-carboxyvinyltransferase, partial [Mucilaginibacter polytrichastri]|nr:3-phosphoshikimate 1-carboxyvinyltransferase [Mucilaginibacter polytrichastri]